MSQGTKSLRDGLRRKRTGRETGRLLVRIKRRSLTRALTASETVPGSTTGEDVSEREALIAQAWRALPGDIQGLEILHRAVASNLFSAQEAIKSTSLAPLKIASPFIAPYLQNSTNEIKAAARGPTCV